MGLSLEFLLQDRTQISVPVTTGLSRRVRSSKGKKSREQHQRVKPEALLPTKHKITNKPPISKDIGARAKLDGTCPALET